MGKFKGLLVVLFLSLFFASCADETGASKNDDLGSDLIEGLTEVTDGDLDLSGDFHEDADTGLETDATDVTDPDLADQVDQVEETTPDIVIEPYCGDSVTQILNGEVCDDGNNTSGDGCSADCTSREICGNDIKDVGEQCDGEDWCDDACRDQRVPLEDADGDSISDEDEGRDTELDSDGDGIPDYLDLDSDDDGIPDIVELDDDNTHTPPPDNDGDGVPNHLDDDADGDGILDSTEGIFDTDGDTVADFLDTDSDADGIADAVEGAQDLDGDGQENFRDTDSDADGIGDALEGEGDADLDSVPNFLDTDSDNDGLSDQYEAGTNTSLPRDSDGDSTPDYLDYDSDNDSLTDLVEDQQGTNPYDADTDNDGINDADDGSSDDDHDGFINALDRDSDNDSVPDSVEAGDDNLMTPPIDTDGDTFPDYLDLDADADGLIDGSEPNCSGVDSRITEDSDGDGFGDMAEVAVGSDPCDDSQGVTDFVDFYFELPYGDPAQSDTLEFAPTVQKADVFFSVDTTSSMDGELSNLKAGLTSTIIPQTRTRVTDSAFGVGSWEDFPLCSFAFAGDKPWRLINSPTTDEALAQAGVEQLTTRNGGDYPESGYEALYQIATGAGISWGAGSGCGQNWAAGLVPTYNGGGQGGVGFRFGTLPIVLHITDATSHVPDDYTPYGVSSHSESQAIAGLNGLGARVITLNSGSNAADSEGRVPNTQLDDISNQTGARVPVCAFKTGASAWRCAPGQCCTGLDGSAEAPDGDQCTLRYTIASNGSGLSDTVVDGIDALVKYSTFDVYTSIRDDVQESLDTTCFLKRVQADSFIAPPSEPEASCTPLATPDDFGGVGYDNGFRDFSTGTSSVSQRGSQLSFLVNAENDTCAPATTEAQIYTVYIDIIDETTGSVLDTREVTIIVPPEISQEL